MLFAIPGLIIAVVTLWLLFLSVPFIVYLHKNHPVLLSMPLSILLIVFVFFVGEFALESSGTTLTSLISSFGDIESRQQSLEVSYELLRLTFLPFMALLANVLIALKVSKKNKIRKDTNTTNLVVD